MKRNYHIYIKWGLEPIYVTDFKFQIGIIVFFCSLTTFFNDIFLEIKSYHIYLEVHYFCKIIVHYKGQIRLSTTKVYDIQFFYFKIRNFIVDDFDKAVNLFVFVIHRIDYFSIFRKHTHVHKRSDIHTFL